MFLDQKYERGEVRSYGKREENRLTPRNTLNEWKKVQTPGKSSNQLVGPASPRFVNEKKQVLISREKPSYRHARSPTMVEE